jgi:hypothetical protein
MDGDHGRFPQPTSVGAARSSKAVATEISASRLARGLRRASPHYSNAAGFVQPNSTRLLTRYRDQSECVFALEGERSASLANTSPAGRDPRRAALRSWPVTLGLFDLVPEGNAERLLTAEKGIAAVMAWATGADTPSWH